MAIMFKWWLPPLVLIVGVVILVASKGFMARSAGVLLVIVGGLLSILELCAFLAVRQHS